MGMTLAAELHIDEPQLRVAESDGRAALRAVIGKPVISARARLRFGPGRTCELVARLLDRAIVQAEAAGLDPGLLVVADTWMPGWGARVDGLPAPVLRGNYAQRVIPLVEPGRHTIALDYRPPGFVMGCAVTAVSALVWILACGVAINDRLRRRRSLRRRLPVLPQSDGNERRARPLHRA